MVLSRFILPPKTFVGLYLSSTEAISKHQTVRLSSLLWKVHWKFFCTLSRRSILGKNCSITMGLGTNFIGRTISRNLDHHFPTLYYLQLIVLEIIAVGLLHSRVPCLPIPPLLLHLHPVHLLIPEYDRQLSFSPSNAVSWSQGLKLMLFFVLLWPVRSVLKRGWSIFCWALMWKTENEKVFASDNQ